MFIYLQRLTSKKRKIISLIDNNFPLRLITLHNSTPFPASFPVNEEPDIPLLQAAQCGDRTAMHKLLQPWNDPIYGFLVQMLRNREDAEDAAQETFIRIVKGLPRYEHRGAFRAWIFQIARNQAALTANRRKRVHEREFAVEPATLQAMPDTTEERDLLTQVDRAAALRLAVSALPDAEREVVELRLNEDLKFREISERTGAPLNTVLGRMRNAMRRLRETIQPLQS
jgi:RNA polymerase sigma-70 factor (ECF subfamily)